LLETEGGGLSIQETHLKRRLIEKVSKTINPKHVLLNKEHTPTSHIVQYMAREEEGKEGDPYSVPKAKTPRKRTRTSPAR